MLASMMGRVAAALAAVALLVLIDVRTKSWAAAELRTRGPRTLVGGHLRLQYSENKGLAFGRLRDGTRQSAIIGYSAVMSLALLGVLVHRLLRKRPAGFLLPAGCAALLAGTLGNLHDRLERGYVIDFIDVQRVDWPAFNVADVVIALGIGLCLAGLVAAALRHRRASASGLA
jgi:signal peptidase II